MSKQLDYDMMVLTLIRIGDGYETTAKQRVKDVLPHVINTIKRFEIGDGQLAFTDSDGVTCGYLSIIDKPLHSFRGAIQQSQGFDKTADSVLILELTENMEGNGFSKAWTWMQHRSSQS